MTKLTPLLIWVIMYHRSDAKKRKKSLISKQFGEDKASISREPLGLIHMKVFFENGDTYEGEFKDGNRDGKGYFISMSGWYYDGVWKDNKKHGYGKLVVKDGSFYEGEWRDDDRNGLGKYSRANEYIYQGQWRDGKRDGQGENTYTDGCCYEGEWKNDKMHGQGKYVFPDVGCSYEGQYKNGKKDGLGTYTKENEIIYKGEYKEGKKDGQGLFKNPNGTVYEGRYKEGKKHGQGIIYKNGVLYRAQFEDGRKIYDEVYSDIMINRQLKHKSDTSNETPLWFGKIFNRQNLALRPKRKELSTNIVTQKSVKIIRKLVKIICIRKPRRKSICSLSA